MKQVDGSAIPQHVSGGLHKRLLSRRKGLEMTTQGLRVASAGSAGQQTMKAIRIHRPGGPEALVYEDVPVPAMRPGDALVRVHAAGVSPAEFTWRIYETPDGRSRLPKIPSHEVSGVVVGAAPDVRVVAVGDAVYAL